MRIAICLVLLNISFCSKAQAPYDSTKNRQTQSAYGYSVGNYSFNTIVLPKDTVKMAVRDSGAVAFVNGNVFKYSGYSWSKIGSVDNAFVSGTMINDSTLRLYTGGGDSSTFLIKGSGSSSSGITSLGSGWGLNNVNDSTYEVDSSVVASKSYVDAKDALNVTNVFRKTATDSVFQTKGGVDVFAFKGSSGGGLPGGINNSVQFNTSGFLTGSANFTYDSTSGELFFTKSGSLNKIKFKPNSTGTSPQIELTYAGGSVQSFGINSLNTGTYSNNFAVNNNLKATGLLLGTSPLSTSNWIGTSSAPTGSIFLAPTGGSAYIMFVNVGASNNAIIGTSSANGDFIHFRNPTSGFNGTEVYRIVRASGNFLIGTSTDIASSILTVNSTTKGFLQPRMTTTQKTGISSPDNGLSVYDTDNKQPYYYDGTSWKAQVGMEFGTAAPTSTPDATGLFFLDKTNKKLYISTGTSSSVDWNILN